MAQVKQLCCGINYEANFAGAPQKILEDLMQNNNSLDPVLVCRGICQYLTWDDASDEYNPNFNLKPGHEPIVCFSHQHFKMALCRFITCTLDQSHLLPLPSVWEHCSQLKCTLFCNSRSGSCRGLFASSASKVNASKLLFLITVVMFTDHLSWGHAILLMGWVLYEVTSVPTHPKMLSEDSWASGLDLLHSTLIDETWDHHDNITLELHGHHKVVHKYLNSSLRLLEILLLPQETLRWHQ
jgi:hypothetical protein